MLVVRADGFVDPCIPSRTPKPPSGPDWVHDIKHAGLVVGRDCETVRPARSPAKLRAKSPARKDNAMNAMLYAFDFP
jgi:hypothetical protein